jgi:lysozyme
MASGRTVVTTGAGASLIAVAIAAILPNVQTFEGNSNIPYRDVGGVLTVCNGHTGPDVVVNKYYPPSQCAQLTTSDLNKAASGVLNVSPQLKYHPMQLASAISFSYNVGVGNYAKSSVAKEFNIGNFETGCSELLKYTYADGKYNKGLADRRQQEYKICISTLTPGGLAYVADSSTRPSK